MADTTFSLDPGLLDRNLDALRRKHPDLAAQLLAARGQLPEAVCTPTRDGTLNFRIRRPDGRQAWFGRTSIPGVRAAALVDVFDAGQANVLLPGIAEGSEAKLLLRRLAPHRAVFVWEDSTTNLLRAMALHDFGGDIDRGRLVFVLADEADLANALLETLRRLPGHLCPDRMLLWPWQTSTGISACKSAIESACQQIERERLTQLTGLKNRLSALSGRADTAAPRTAALFAIHPNEETWAWADALAGAASEAGWRMASVVLRGPADLHPLARAGRLTEGLDRAPDFALLLDVCRADIADVLPSDVPAISWLTHEPVSGARLADRIGPDDRVVATSSVLAERLDANGVHARRITVRPLPVLARCADAPDWEDRPIDVAIVASLAPTDPQSHGFELPTHAGIWNAVLELIKSGIDEFTDARLPQLFARAESKVRVRIDDPNVLDQMTTALGGSVAESLIWHNLIQALSGTGFKIECRGSGLPETPGLNVVREVPSLAGRLDFYKQAKCVVFASPTGLVRPDILLAAEAGAAVVWRSHPRDQTPGGLATLLAPGSEAVLFARNQALAPALGRLLASPDVWRSTVTAARSRCRSDHAPASALAPLQAVATSFLSSR